MPSGSNPPPVPSGKNFALTLNASCRPIINAQINTVSLIVMLRGDLSLAGEFL